MARHLMERRLNLPFDGPDHSLWHRGKIRPQCSSSGQKSFMKHAWATPWTRGRRWTDDLFIWDTEDRKTIPPSESHIKRFKSIEVDIRCRDNEFLYSHAGRANYWKHSSRHPSLCTEREATLGNNLRKNLWQKKEKPEIQVQILKLDKFSGVSR